MDYTNINEYTYHIKDDYFIKMGNKQGLMENKENGHFRPNYFSIKDSDTDIQWMIPLSSKIDKYKEAKAKKIAKRGYDYTIVIDRYCGKECVFLIQNMFPILPKYIDHIHTVSSVPVKVHKSIRNEIDKCLKEVFRLWNSGNIITFTKIDELYNLQYNECKVDSYNSLNIITKQTEISINLGENFDFASIITVNNGQLSVSQIDYKQIGEQKVIATAKDKFNQIKEVFIKLTIFKQV